MPDRSQPAEAKQPTPEQLDQLTSAALEVRKNAYAPHSNFSVGAAVLAAGGQIYTGVNVENSSFGLTLCAERVAATAAVTAGSRAITAVAIATEGAHGPCGACRQFLFEFAVGDMQVVLLDANDPKNAEYQSLNALLPHGFKLPKGK